MMKKFLIVAAAAACVFTLAACKSTNTSDAGSLNHYPQTVGPTDHYRPLYKVDPANKVEGKARVNVLFGIFKWGDSSKFADNASVFWFLSPKNIASQAAFYNACAAGKCDAVVAARYEIDTTDYFVFQKYDVKVKGFPAVLTGIETVKPMPYYINGKGEIVVMKEFVTPYLLFDAKSGSGWLF